MKVVAVVVPFFTYRWSRIFLRTLRQHLPELHLLAIDNNPVPGERLPKRWKHDHAVKFFPDCELERQLYQQAPGVTYIQNTEPGSQTTRTHGHGMDLATKWCREHGVELMIHIEPDSIVAGREWFDRLMAAAAEKDCWVAMSSKTPYGAYIPTPGIFHVDKISHSFEWVYKGHDLYTPAHRQLLDYSTFDTKQWQNSLIRHWDEGEKIWFEATRHGRFKHTENPDYYHFGFSRARQPEWWLGSRVDGKTIRNMTLSFHPLDDQLLERLRNELLILDEQDGTCFASKPITDYEILST